MRPMYDPEVDVFRSQVQSFLAKNLPTDWQGIGVLPAVEAHAWVMEWRKILHRERYLRRVGQPSTAVAECTLSNK